MHTILVRSIHEEATNHGRWYEYLHPSLSKDCWIIDKWQSCHPLPTMQGPRRLFKEIPTILTQNITAIWTHRSVRNSFQWTMCSNFWTPACDKLVVQVWSSNTQIRSILQTPFRLPYSYSWWNVGPLFVASCWIRLFAGFQTGPFCSLHEIHPCWYPRRPVNDGIDQFCEFHETAQFCCTTSSNALYAKLFVEIGMPLGNGSAETFELERSCIEYVLY